MTSVVVSVCSVFLPKYSGNPCEGGRIKKKIILIVQFSKSGHPNLFGLCKITCKSWVIKGRETLF